MDELVLTNTATAKLLHEVIKFPAFIHQVGSIGYVEKMIIGSLVLVVEPRVIVETGVFKGQTTRFLSEFLHLNCLKGRVVGFDLPEVISEVTLTEGFF